jgi:hypothetical protein
LDLGSLRHTETQPEQVESGMGAFREAELNLRLYFENEGCNDMAEKHIAPSHIHTELTLQALERAMSGIRFIQENDMSTSEFRDRLPEVLDELKKATYYLKHLRTPSTSTPMFLNN